MTKIIQITAIPASEDNKPCMFCVGDDWRAYAMPLTKNGTGEWKKLPELPN